MHETSGVLRPAIEAYLNNHVMTGDQIAAMRAYLRQWIAADWRSPGSELYALRISVNWLFTQDAIKEWLAYADAIDIDPL